MENKRAKAHISWLTFEEGGRKHPLDWSKRADNEYYWGVAKFEGAKEDWSARVFADSNGTNFGIQFLADQAPHELLVPGHKFELKEGRKVVARGEIL